MATKKKSSSGSDPKSKRVVKKKMETVMDEYKHHQLKSGRSGKTVTNPKQAIAIGLSEARRSGADIPESPNKKPTGKKTAAKKAVTKKAPAKKSAVKTAATKKSVAKKTAAKKRA